jgi:hypothetical protein
LEAGSDRIQKEKVTKRVYSTPFSCVRCLPNRVIGERSFCILEMLMNLDTKSSKDSAFASGIEVQPHHYFFSIKRQNTKMNNK